MFEVVWIQLMSLVDYMHYRTGYERRQEISPSKTNSAGNAALFGQMPLRRLISNF